MKFILALTVAAALGGCASVSAIPLSKDSFQITSTASGACGSDGAQQVAFKQAAAETIRRGYDSFIITGSDGKSQVIGASVYGGSASYGHVYRHGLTVKMYRLDDPEAANAIPARETLGADWQKAVKSKNSIACT